MKKEELTKEIDLRISIQPDYAKRIHEYGFVEMEDSWGDEASIINNARVSVTDNRINSVSDIGDREKRLLYHLMKNNHGTPFESMYFRFRVIAPIFIIRQWIRHRISSYNEFSQRYRSPMDMYYVPSKEARTDTIQTDFEIMDDIEVEEYLNAMNTIFKYNENALQRAYSRIDLYNINETDPKFKDRARARARELFRNVIPVAGYTDLYWTINFRSLMNFFNLRIDPGHTQQEIMDYAVAMQDMCRKKYPILMKTYDRVRNERIPK